MKTSLAASLAYRPRLLILDEPFGGLDVLVREQLIETILERTPELTVLLASHDLGEIESFATHVGYLNQGRLEFVEEMSVLRNDSATSRSFWIAPPRPAISHRIG